MWKRSRNMSSTRASNLSRLGMGMTRDRVAILAALITIAGLFVALSVSKDTNMLMPGPLASVHGAIDKCWSCHANSGTGKLSWLHGFLANDRLSDSKQCLKCHSMPQTAFEAHGAASDVLMQSTARLTKVSASAAVPRAAQAQHSLFPVHQSVAGQLACATCHQEHQGGGFKLSKMTSEQCRSCHVVKFDSFDGSHPKFEDYPFRRRTRIIYDHAGHFGKHYPELREKDPAKRIPETCTSCHDGNGNKHVMAVSSFDKTCAGCHRDQITGKERSSGPKGIAFLSLPGLDIATLKKKNATIGEWPEESDAALTPFMKVMIARSDKGRTILSTLEGVNLQDLSAANDAQLKSTTELAWEVKALFHALIDGKASDVLGDFKIGGDVQLSAGLTSDLTAGLPRDVIVSAQREWLPNLAKEIAERRVASRADASQPKPPAPDASTPSPASQAGEGKRDTSSLPPAMKLGMYGYSTDVGRKGRGTQIAADNHDDNSGRVPLPSGTPRSIEADRAKANEPAPVTKPNRDEKTGGASEPPANRAGSDAGGQAATPAAEAPPSSPGDQGDDLLQLTPEEARAMKSGPSGATPPTAASIPATSTSAKAAEKATLQPETTAPSKAAVVVNIGSDIDPESWAEFGGWYRQDFAIYYRPTGHKDKFMYSWLFLTGPQAANGEKSPTATVFDALTGKDAQGSCTKCHSVDDISSKGRLVNFSPLTAEDKKGQFTRFSHEPHLGIMENRGCVTCHELQKGRPYVKSYEQGSPQSFASEFSQARQDLCKSCHNSTAVRQDCTQCHAYHVNGVTTSIIGTKIPPQ